MILSRSPSYSIFCPSCGMVMGSSIHNMECPRCKKISIYNIVWHDDEVHFLFEGHPAAYRIMDDIYVEIEFLEIRGNPPPGQYDKCSLIVYKDKEISVPRDLLYSYQILKRS